MTSVVPLSRASSASMIQYDSARSSTAAFQLPSPDRKGECVGGVTQMRLTTLTGPSGENAKTVLAGDRPP